MCSCYHLFTRRVAVVERAYAYWGQPSHCFARAGQRAAAGTQGFCSEAVDTSSFSSSSSPSSIQARQAWCHYHQGRGGEACKELPNTIRISTFLLVTRTVQAPWDRMRRQSSWTQEGRDVAGPDGIGLEDVLRAARLVHHLSLRVWGGRNT